MSATAFTSSTDESLMRAISGPPSKIELCDVRQCEPVGHAGDEVDDLLRLVAPIDQMAEDPPHGCVRPVVLHPYLRPEVDALEHEVPESVHRCADLLALHDVSPARRVLDQIVHE